MEGVVRDDSLVNISPTKAGIYYGVYSGDIGLGNGFGTFLTICGQAGGGISTSLQIAHEHYGDRCGIRFSYSSSAYYRWILTN